MTMKLYFSPLACSMATRICLYEAGAEAAFIEVDPKTKRTLDGRDYRAVHPLGMVPALDIGEAEVLTENAAILQYVAARFPGAGLAPSDAAGRARLQQWLCFVGTELHRGVFGALLDESAPEDARRYALDKAPARLAHAAARLATHDYLLDTFSAADAYLFTVLSWAVVTPIDLKAYPALPDYLARVHRRPSVARAVSEERPLYAAELARHQAA
jgi:glutathione S-transferase